MKPWDKDWTSTDSATPKAKTPAPAATVPWNKDWSGVQSTTPSKLSQPPAPERNTGAGGDLMTDVKRGALDIPSALTGIADIAPALAGAGTPVSDFFEEVGKESGFEPGKWSEEAKEEYSPERVAIKAKLDKAWDEGSAKDVAVQMLAHPVHNIGGLVAESFPATLVGGGVGKAAMMAGRAVLPKAAAAISPKAAAVAGGAVGEGAIGAGSAMADFQGEDTQRGAVAALGSGAITGLLGAAGGKVAQKIGLADVDTLFTGGLKSLDTKTQRGIMKRIAAGATAESVLEELPQSLQEYAWSQWAEDKPVDMKGLARAGVEGLAAGAVMGGGAAGLFKPNQAITPPPAPDPVNPPPADPQANTIHPITGEFIPAPARITGPTTGQLRFPGAEADIVGSPDFIQPEGGPMLTPEQAANPPAPGFVEAGIGTPTPPLGPMAKAVARLPAPPAPPIEGQGQTETMPAIEAGQADTTDQDIAEDLGFLEGFDLSEQDLDKAVVDDMAILDSFIEAAPTKKKQTERLVERNLDTSRQPVSTEGIDQAETVEFEEIEAAPAPLARPGTKGIEVDQAKTQDVETVSAEPKRPGTEGISVQEQTGTVENIELAPPPKAPTNKKELTAAANEASTSPTNEMVQPSEAQIQAGNYKKGHVQIQGLDISIENPRGSTRSGKDKDGTQWNRLMKDHYGYIKGSVGKDKDHIDVFLGDLAHSENAPVFVVDQVDPETGKFDEHKVMMGYPSAAYARRAYNSNYAPGWNGAGEITKVSQADFKAWLASGKTKKPFALEEKAEGPKVKKDQDYTSEDMQRLRDFTLKHPNDPKKTFRSGILPTWVKAMMTEQGFDPKNRDHRLAFRYAEMQKTASGQFASMANKYKAQYAFEAALIKKYGRPIVEPMIKSGQTTSMWEERNKPAPLTSPQDQAAAKAVARAEEEETRKAYLAKTEAEKVAAEKKKKQALIKKSAAQQRKARKTKEAADKVAQDKAKAEKYKKDRESAVKKIDAAWDVFRKNSKPAHGRSDPAWVVHNDDGTINFWFTGTSPVNKWPAGSKPWNVESGTKYDLFTLYIYEETTGSETKAETKETAESKTPGFNLDAEVKLANEAIPEGYEIEATGKTFGASRRGANGKSVGNVGSLQDQNAEGIAELIKQVKLFDANARAVQQEVYSGPTMSDPVLEASGDPKAFKAALTKAVTEWAHDEIGRRIESASGDISHQLDGFTTVVSSNGKELDPDTYDAKTIEAMRKEAQGRKVRQDAAKRKKEHEVVIAEAVVAAFTSLPSGTDLPSFTTGWDHALRGGSQSSIDKSGEYAKDAQAGYDAAQKWLSTKDGQAFRAGKPVRKMKGSGEQLKRHGDRTKDIKTDDATKFVEELIKATNRAQFFTPGEGATPGAVKMLEMFRMRAKTFQDYWARWTEGDENIGGKRWQVTAKEVMTKRAATEKGRDEMRSMAEDYIEHAEFFSPLSGHASVAALGDAYNKMQHEAANTKDQDFKAWRVLDLGNFRLTGLAPGGSDYNVLEKHENDPTVGGSRKKKLMRPKLDKVRRDELPDYRKGKTIDAATLEKTFGLGGVTYGKSVTGQQRKDHTNYAYDALNDLAALLKIKPKEIGFNGKLYLAFGALGRGRHAAHYQPMHSLESGGTVQAINLTNTKGDGSLAHEWFHAFDWNQRQNLTGGSDAQEGVVRNVLTVLKYTFPSEDELRTHLMSFLKGQSHWRGSKRDGEKENGKQFLERAKRNFERLATHGSTGDMWAGPRRTQYWAWADKLGKDYWGNQAELFARAGEAFVYDQLEGRSNYLVNDWVEAEAVMAPQYRGKPYPGKEERDLFNEAFNRLFHSSQTDKDMNSLAGKLGRDRADVAQRLIDELDTIYANLQAEKTKPPTESTLSADDYIEESENPTPPQNPTPKPPPSKDSKMSADELADLFDEVLDEETEASQEDDRGGTTPEPTPDPKESTNPVLVDDPHQGIRRLVRTLEKHDFHEIPMDWRRLFSLADEAFEGTQAEGAYTPKDAYDALETAINKQFSQRGMPGSMVTPQSLDMAEGIIDYLGRLQANLPTQTKRTKEQDEFQQYSTPYAHAAVMARVANLRSDDVLLEPTAGTGNLAAMAVAGGQIGWDRVVANELSPRRAELVEEAGAVHVYRENAEQLNNIIGKDVQPTVVIMNPPFSATAGRTNKLDQKTAQKHIDQALGMLAPGGRLVALVGKGMTFESATHKYWWHKIASENTVRANIGINGKEYTKFGTSFDNRLLVIDKIGHSANWKVKLARGEDLTVAEALPLLEEIRNERVHSGERFTSQLSGQEVAGTGRISESKQGSSAAAGGVGTGGSTTERGSVPGEGGTVRGDSGTGSSDTSGRNERTGGNGSGRKRDTGKRGPGGTKPKGGVKGGTKSTTKSDRELKDIASSFAKNGVKGVDEAINGLYELFGGAALKSFPGGIDEKTYQKAKPHFQAMADKFLAAGNDIKEFFRALIKQFGGGIKPYAVRFVMEYQDDGPKTGESQNPVDTAPSEDVPEQDTGEPEELGDGRYSTYKPQRVFRKGKSHPGKLVESSAMASVDAPPIKKAPKLPAGVVAQGKLSDAQLFGVAAANQAHAQILPNGERLGYFFGDGTGVGKGREIVGTIANNMMEGRKKAVWVSVNFDLFSSAQRDYSNVMGNSDALFEGGGAKMKLDNIIERDEGVMFTTYNTLTSKRAAKGDQEERSRLDQMVEWLGEDFDGVIAFDESHLMGNSISVKGERGTSKPSKRALIGMELQAKLPKARILYVSATGATEVHNLGYADRLGLWGEGTAFPTKQEFFTSMNSGGLAAMEVVAKDLKASGKYQARSLSFDDVTYGKLEHALDGDQTKMYNKVAEAWQIVLNNVHAALEMTEGQKDSDARRGSLGQFWGAHQRFFNQVITSMQMPSVIESIKADLAAGRSPVIQLVNTYEAAQKRAVQDMQATGGNLDDLDITPKQGLMQYIEKSFPVHQYEEYTDDDGNTRTRPVLKASTEHTDPVTGKKTITPGDPVENADAVALREKLLNELSLLRVPEGPLDVLLSEFGPETVAEVTGRKKRYYLKEDENGDRVRVEETVSKSSMQQDAKDYMADKKRILVFSYAGGTGASYNADLDSKNQRKRVHYLLQPGWRADLAIQGLGRSHRSHQKQAPHVVLVSTNLRGHRRFIASIARRMDQLGALTKGQRDTGGQGIFSAEYNLETEYSEAAIESLITKVRADEIEGVTTDTFIHDMGLGKRDKDGIITGFDTPSVPHFLNRILSLKVDDQALVFDSFFEILQDVIQNAAENGTLDVGMETLQADRIEVKNEQVLRTDETTGAQTKYAELNLYEKIVPLEFDKLLQATAAGGAEIKLFAKNKRSGKVYAFLPTVNLTLVTGQVVRQLRRVGAVSTTKIQADAIGDPTKPNSYYTRQARAKWDYVSEAEARELWAEDIRTAPIERMKKKHFITGTLLPVWDRLPQSMVRIMRAQLDNGKMMVGRLISQKELDPTLKALGAQSRWKNTSNKEFLSMVIDKGATVVLSNRWRLDRRMLSGENRIELTGWRVGDLDMLTQQGAFSERVSYRTRLFIPTGAKGVEVMDRIMKGKDVVEVVLPNSAQAESEEGEAIYQRAQSKGTGENEPPANKHADLNNMVKLREAVGRFLGKASLARLEAAKLVRLVQSSSDLPGNQPANTRGIWDGRSIWLVADHLGPLHHTVTEAILLHEGEHAGMKNLLGNSYRGIQNRFDDLLRNGDPAAESAMRRVTRDTLPEHVEAERLAYFIEEAYLRQSRGDNLGGQAATLLREILNAIKAWFRATDFGKMLSEQGVEFKLTDDFAIALAKQALKRSTTPLKPPGGGRRPMGTPVGQMEQRSKSLTGDVTQTPAFNKWFGDSKVVDEKGKPLVVYHSTKSNIDEFKIKGLSGGFFFSSSSDINMTPRLGDLKQPYQSGSNIVPAFLSIKRLKSVNGFTSDPIKENVEIEQAKKEGYDGLAFVIDGEPVTYVAFSPTQIKSAIGNQGTFDSTDPNIQRSQGSTSQDATMEEAFARAGLGKDTRTLGEKLKDSIGHGFKENAEALKERVLEGTFDQFHGIKRAIESVRGVLPAENNGYVAARLSTGLPSTLYAAMRYGAPEWRDGVLSRKADSKGLLQILDPVKKDQRAFFGWMVARRAQRLKGEDKENNLSQEHIDALLSNHRERFEEVAAELDAFNSSVLDVAEQAGLIDPKKRAAWEHSDYIPFYRVREGGFTGPGGKKGIAGQSSGINKLTGGPEALNDPLANLAQNAAHLLDAAMKNHAMAQVTENLEGSDFMEKQPNIAYKKDIMPRSQVRTILKEAGMSKEELKLIPRAALDGFAEIWSIKPPDGPDVVRVMRGGKPEYYKVNDESLLRGLTAVNQEAFGGVVAVMRGFKRLLTTMVTSEPTFMARNFIRDAVHAWTINEDGFTLGVDSIKGAAKSLREEGGMVDMLFAGASFMGGFVNANDPKAMADAIRRGLREKGFKRAQEDSYMGTLVHGSKDLWAAYQHIGDAIENANRETIYEAGTKLGKSKAQRVFDARDFMDYSMRGNFSTIRLLGDVLPFFNARLQGLYKLGRAGAIPGMGMKREIIAKGGMVAVASVALAMLNGDNEDYEELPDWDKDSNWHIMGGQGKDKFHYRIPKPFELGLLFGTMPERIARNMMGNDDGGRTAERFLWALTSTLEVNPFPQAIRPLAEVWANEDMFTKRPIENMADEGVLPSARYNERTSDTMRVLSDLFGDSTGLGPKRLEHLWTGYMGTLGSYMLAVTDMLTREAQGKPVKADARVDDIPVLKAFVRGDVARGTQYQIDFYDALREVRQTWTTVRRFAKEGRMVEAKELLADNADTIKYRKFLETKQKQLRVLRKAQDLISRDPDMTGVQKRKRTDELQRQINQTSRHAVRVIDDKTY